MPKFFFRALLFFMVILGISIISVSAKSPDGDYIIRFSENSPLMLATDDSDNLKPVIPEWGIYQCSGDDIDQISEMPGIVSFEPIYPLHLADTPEVLPNDPIVKNPWNLNIINMPECWYWRNEGKGIRIGILDSGIDSSHPDLKNMVLIENNYTKKDNEEFVDPNNVMDKAGHGTAVAGIAAAETNNGIGISGVSQAEIVSLRIFGDDGGYTSWLIQAIKDAVDVYECDVINISLTFVGESTELKNAIDYALSKNVIVVAASGNYSDNCEDALRYPAAFDGVISTGSVDSTGAYYSGSVANSKVTAVAPGVSIASLYPGNRYMNATGTSFASPHMAGVAAVMKGIKPSLTPTEFETLIKDTANDITLQGVGKDIFTGYGLIDMEKMADKLLKEKGLPVVSRVAETSSGLSVWCKNYSSTESLNGIQIWRICKANQLQKPQPIPFSIPALESKHFTYDASMSSDETYKFLLWSDFKNITPLWAKS